MAMTTSHTSMSSFSPLPVHQQSLRPVPTELSITATHPAGRAQSTTSLPSVTNPYVLSPTPSIQSTATTQHSVAFSSSQPHVGVSKTARAKRNKTPAQNHKEDQQHADALMDSIALGTYEEDPKHQIQPSPFEMSVQHQIFEEDNPPQSHSLQPPTFPQQGRVTPFLGNNEFQQQQVMIDGNYLQYSSTSSASSTSSPQNFVAQTQPSDSPLVFEPAPLTSDDEETLRGESVASQAFSNISFSRQHSTVSEVLAWELEDEELVIGAYEMLLLALGAVTSTDVSTSCSAEFSSVRDALHISEPLHQSISSMLHLAMSTGSCSGRSVPSVVSLPHHIHLAFACTPDPSEKFAEYQSFFGRHVSLFLSGLVRLDVSHLLQSVKRMKAGSSTNLAQKTGHKEQGLVGLRDNIQQNLKQLVSMMGRAREIVLTSSVEELFGGVVGVEEHLPQIPEGVISDFKSLYAATFSAFDGSPPLQLLLAEALRLCQDLGLISVRGNSSASTLHVEPLGLQVDMYNVLLQACLTNKITQSLNTNTCVETAFVQQADSIFQQLSVVARSFEWLEQEHLTDLCVVQTCVSHYATSRNISYLQSVLDPLPGTLPVESALNGYVKATRRLGGGKSLKTHTLVLQSIVEHLKAEVVDHHMHYDSIG